MPRLSSSFSAYKVYGKLVTEKALFEFVVGLRRGFVGRGKPRFMREHFHARVGVEVNFIIVEVHRPAYDKKTVADPRMFDRVAEGLQSCVGMGKDQPAIKIEMYAQCLDVVQKIVETKTGGFRRTVGTPSPSRVQVDN